MATDIAWNLIAIVSLGMAISVLAADFRSARTGLLALMFAMQGLALLLDATFIMGTAADALPTWANWATLPAPLAIIALGLWLRLIRRSAQVTHEDHAGERAIRFSFVAIVLYAVVAFLAPEWRVAYLFRLDDEPLRVLREPRFHAVFLPILAASGLLYFAMIRTLMLQPDPPERLRLMGFCVATPILLLSLFMSREAAPYFAVTGQMVLLVAVMQYHMQWGQRGQFMARFLSPQVATAVRDRGLDSALHEDRREITVVACDIRGFSRFAEEHDSGQVLQLLQAYYNAVGEVAARHCATIKDYAGDGILLLVGAPLATRHHADTAVAMAMEILDSCAPLWQARKLDLGMGVASGVVNVGVVGTSPMEYAAVGRAVNLAARLTDHAAGGEILVSERTVELLADRPEGIQPMAGEGVQFKGLAEPVRYWCMGRQCSIRQSETVPERGAFDWLTSWLARPGRPAGD